jgi:hypothetical protein
MKPIDRVPAQSKSYLTAPKRYANLRWKEDLGMSLDAKRARGSVRSSRAKGKKLEASPRAEKATPICQFTEGLRQSRTNE